jgi:hypothetical protein
LRILGRSTPPRTHTVASEDTEAVQLAQYGSPGIPVVKHKVS